MLSCLVCFFVGEQKSDEEEEEERSPGGEEKGQKKLDVPIFSNMNP